MSVPELNRAPVAELPPAQQLVKGSRGLLLIGVLAALHLLLTGTIIFCFNMQSEFSNLQELIWFLVLLGSCSSQACLLSVWAALGSGSNLLRLVGATGLLLIAWYSLPAALGMFDPTSHEPATVFPLFALFTFFISQLILWPLRWLLGLRFRSLATLADDGAERRLQLRLTHLVGWSVLFVLPLAALHAFLVPADEIAWVALGLGSVSLVTITTCLPCLIIASRRGWPWFIGLWAYLLGLCVLEVLLIDRFMSSPPIGRGHITLGLATWNGVLILPMVLTCLLTRTFGYRISTKRG